MISGLVLALLLTGTVTIVQDSTSGQWLRAGNMARQAFQYEEALRLYDRALDASTREGNSRNELNAILGQGWANKSLSRFRPAIDGALRVYELSSERADTMIMVQALELIGITYLDKADMDSAYIWLNAYHDLAVAANAGTHVSYALSTIAGVYRHNNQLEKAIETIQKSIELAQSTNDTIRLIIAYREMARMYSGSWNLQKSLEYGHKALYLSEVLGDDSHISTQLNNLAITYSLMGDYVTELQYATRSLEIRRRYLSPNQISYALYNIAHLYYRTGQFELALTYNQECLEIELEYGRPFDIIYTLTQASSILEMLGRQEEARDYARKAIDLGYEHELWQRITFPYRNLARSYITDNEPVKAIEVIDQGIELIETTGFDRIINEFYLLRGNAYSMIGLHDEALQNYRSALDYFRDFEERQIPPAYFFQMARGLRNTGSDSAWVYAREFIDRNDRYRDNFRLSSGMRAGYLSRFIEQYYEIARWYMEDLGDAEAAYNIIEMARARTFAEGVADAAVDFSSLMDNELQIGLREAESNFREAETALNRSKSDESARRLRDAELAYEAVISRIRNESELYNLYHNPDPLSLSLARKLIGMNTAVISYTLTGTHLTGIAFSSGHTSHWVIDLKDSGTGDIAGLITAFRKAIENGEPVSDLMQSGSELTALLIEPARDVIGTAENLILITDGPLSYLPFEAMPWDDSYLIAAFNVKYVPSMTVYSLLLADHSGRTIPNMDMFIVANPDFGNLEQYNAFINTSLSRLPHTRIEADSVAALFRNVTRVQGKQATEAQLAVHDLSRYRYIHLATHGIVNEQNPRLSGLVLAPNDPGTGSGAYDDAFLRVPDIHNLRLNADLVVLSACNTGLGQIMKGEGILGLQRAFFLAGARSVMVTLWPVQDRSTSMLMSRFYNELRLLEEEKNSWRYRLAGWFGSEPDLYGSHAIALRNAKLGMIDDIRYNHPRYWGGFVLTGL